ncbi:MAG: GNAT family N-acetyltransferase [Gammaproteobacteria bacterium]|nr:GNAT family N-acetyltransferase [Gammaproteobacteria bacterium]
MLVRAAKPEDAAAFCEVIRSSIVKLCERDYLGGNIKLDEWLKNKTADNCCAWIEDKASNSFVAEIENEVVGVSHIDHSGHLHLCYVSPNVVGRGVGKMLLNAAERSVAGLGLSEITLESTVTSKTFYERHGYKFVGKTERCLSYVKAV